MNHCRETEVGDRLRMLTLAWLLSLTGLLWLAMMLSFSPPPPTLEKSPGYGNK